MTIPFSQGHNRAADGAVYMSHPGLRPLNVEIKSKLHTVTYKAAHDLASHYFCLTPLCTSLQPHRL